MRRPGPGRAWQRPVAEPAPEPGLRRPWPFVLNHAAVARGSWVIKSQGEGPSACSSRVSAPRPGASPSRPCPRRPPTPGPRGSPLPLRPGQPWTQALPGPWRRAEHVQAFSQMSCNFPSFPLRNTLIKRTLLGQPIDIQRRVLLKSVPISLEAIVCIVETAHGRAHVHTHVHAHVHAPAADARPRPRGVTPWLVPGLLGWIFPFPWRLPW